jgi:hypothetical protein
VRCSILMQRIFQMKCCTKKHNSSCEMLYDESNI